MPLQDVSKTHSAYNGFPAIGSNAPPEPFAAGFKPPSAAISSSTFSADGRQVLTTGKGRKLVAGGSFSNTVGGSRGVSGGSGVSDWEDPFRILLGTRRVFFVSVMYWSKMCNGIFPLEGVFITRGSRSSYLRFVCSK